MLRLRSSSWTAVSARACKAQAAIWQHLSQELLGKGRAAVQLMHSFTLAQPCGLPLHSAGLDTLISHVQHTGPAAGSRRLRPSPPRPPNPLASHPVPRACCLAHSPSAWPGASSHLCTSLVAAPCDIGITYSPVKCTQCHVPPFLRARCQQPPTAPLRQHCGRARGRRIRAQPSEAVWEHAEEPGGWPQPPQPAGEPRRATEQAQQPQGHDGLPLRCLGTAWPNLVWRVDLLASVGRLCMTARRRHDPEASQMLQPGSRPRVVLSQQHV